MIRKLPLVMLFALGVLLVACDTFVQFKAFNATNEPISVGWSYNACPQPEAAPPRLRESKVVAPQSELNVARVTGSEAKCVVITNESQTVRIYEGYVDNARYVIQDSADRSGIAVAVEAPEPAVPAETKGLRDLGIGFYVVVASLALGAVAALVITVQFFLKRAPSGDES